MAAGFGFTPGEWSEYKGAYMGRGVSFRSDPVHGG
jgi:hypothetical protein